MVLTAKLDVRAMKVNGSAILERGLVRLDVEVSNDGDSPLENITMKARYNKRDFSPKDGDKANLHHLLPGISYSKSFFLRPRGSVEGAMLGLRISAFRNGEKITLNLDLGSMDINVRGRPYGGADPLPRM